MYSVRSLYTNDISSTASFYNANFVSEDSGMITGEMDTAQPQVIKLKQHAMHKEMSAFQFSHSGAFLGSI